MTNLIDYLQAHQKTVVVVCFVLLALTAGSTLMIDSSHAHTWAEKHVPFFWSFFGFFAASAIIGITRWLGRSGIQASPDVYTCSTSTTGEEE